jgi:hypothetical protein
MLTYGSKHELAHQKIVLTWVIDEFILTVPIAVSIARQ